MTEDIDDEEWERWMALTDEEQDAEMERAIAELDRTTATMTLAQHAAMLRRMAVDNCLGWRRLIRKFDFDDFRDHLREAQKRLVAIRSYRTSGIYPGDDA